MDGNRWTVDRQIDRHRLREMEASALTSLFGLNVFAVEFTQPLITGGQTLRNKVFSFKDSNASPSFSIRIYKAFFCGNMCRTFGPKGYSRNLGLSSWPILVD